MSPRGPQPSSLGRLLSGNGSVSGSNTARACVPHAKRPIPLSRRQTERCSEPVLGRCSRTGRKKIRTERLASRRHQEAWHLDVADCRHTASEVNSWSHENMDENPHTAALPPPSEGCGCLSWVKKVLTEISFKATVGYLMGYEEKCFS